MTRTSRGVALTALAASVTGCAVSSSLTAGPAVTTTGHFGTEARGALAAAAGNKNFRVFLGLAAGPGYLDNLQSGYAVVSPELGIEGGREIQWSGSSFYAPRIPFRGEADVVHGWGAAGHVLFRVARTGGEDGSFLLGPRLSAEAMLVDSSTPEGQRGVGLFQLGLVLRWVMFDTTGKSWTR